MKQKQTKNIPGPEKANSIGVVVSELKTDKQTFLLLYIIGCAVKNSIINKIIINAYIFQESLESIGQFYNI